MSFNKGTLAIIDHGLDRSTTRNRWALERRKRAITVWRRATSEDKAAWRGRQREAARLAEARGEDTFSIYRDDAGESRLSPQDVYLDFELGDIVQIVRGHVGTGVLSIALVVVAGLDGRHTVWGEVVTVDPTWTGSFALGIVIFFLRVAFTSATKKK